MMQRSFFWIQRSFSRRFHSLLLSLICQLRLFPHPFPEPQNWHRQPPLSQHGFGEVWGSRVESAGFQRLLPETHPRGKGRETTSHGGSFLLSEATAGGSELPAEALASLGGPLLPRQQVIATPVPLGQNPYYPSVL